MVESRKFSRGGEIAAFFALAAPWLGALWAGVLVLVPPPREADPILPAPTVLSWIMCASALACAYFLSRLTRSGIRHGKLSAFRLLAVAAVPWALGLLLTPLALFQAWKHMMQGAPIEAFVEPGVAPRLTGLVIGGVLLGAAGFALAVAGFLWRSPGRRAPGLWLALAALAPFTVFVISWMAHDRFTPLPLRAEWIALAALTIPLRLALAGAVVTRPPAAEPGVEWALAVPLANTVLFMAAASLYFGQSFGQAIFAALTVSNPSEAWPVIVDSLKSIVWFGLAGLLLVLIPQGMMLARHYGPASGLRAASRGHLTALLLAGALVVLEALANWHMLATIKPAFAGRPLLEPMAEALAPLPEQEPGPESQGVPVAPPSVRLPVATAWTIIYNLQHPEY